MTEPKTGSDPHIEHQEPSATLIIAIESKSKVYDPDRGGKFTLPEQLRVRSGNANGKTVTIAYNVLPEDKDYYEFKCIYRGTSDTSMPLQKCVSMEGYDVSEVADGRKNPIDHDKLIHFESSSDDLRADAIYEVDWD